MCDVIPSVPGTVNITVSKVDNNSRVVVSWSLPNPLNGVVTKYTVKYREHDSQDDITLSTNVSTREIEISELGEYKHVNNMYPRIFCIHIYVRKYVDVEKFGCIQICMYVRIYVCVCTYLCSIDSLLCPIVPGVPYSVVVIAETGGGAGEESERTPFFSKELSMLTVCILCVPCMYQMLFEWYVCDVATQFIWYGVMTCV